MKITASQLRRIIAEEVRHALTEDRAGDRPERMPGEDPVKYANRFLRWACGPTQPPGEQFASLDDIGLDSYEEETLVLRALKRGKLRDYFTIYPDDVIVAKGMPYPEAYEGS